MSPLLKVTTHQTSVILVTSSDYQSLLEEPESKELPLSYDEEDEPLSHEELLDEPESQEEELEDEELPESQELEELDLSESSSREELPLSQEELLDLWLEPVSKSSLERLGASRSMMVVVL